MVHLITQPRFAGMAQNSVLWDALFSIHFVAESCTIVALIPIIRWQLPSISIYRLDRSPEFQSPSSNFLYDISIGMSNWHYKLNIFRRQPLSPKTFPIHSPLHLSERQFHSSKCSVRFIWNTADKVILLKCKSDSITFQLKTVTWFPISFWGLEIFTMTHKVAYELNTNIMSKTLPPTFHSPSGLWSHWPPDCCSNTLHAPATKFS